MSSSIIKIRIFFFFSSYQRVVIFLSFAIFKYDTSILWFCFPGLPSLAVRGRCNHFDARGRRHAAFVTRMYVLFYNVPGFHALLSPQGLSLRLQPVEVQHLRRAVLQRVRVQLPPAEQEPSMTVCRGAVRSLTLKFVDALLVCYVCILRKHFEDTSLNTLHINGC